jgi:hypothetical protein
MMYALIGGQHLSNYLARFALPYIVPRMVQEFGFTDQQRASILAAFTPGYIMTQIPAAPVCRSMGAKRVLSLNNIGLLAALLSLPTAARVSSSAVWFCIAVMGVMQGPFIVAQGAMTQACKCCYSIPLVELAPHRLRSFTSSFAYCPCPSHLPRSSSRGAGVSMCHRGTSWTGTPIGRLHHTPRRQPRKGGGVSGHTVPVCHTMGVALCVLRVRSRDRGVHADLGRHSAPLAQTTHCRGNWRYSRGKRRQLSPGPRRHKVSDGYYYCAD